MGSCRCDMSYLGSRLLCRAALAKILRVCKQSDGGRSGPAASGKERPTLVDVPFVLSLSLPFPLQKETGFGLHKKRPTLKLNTKLHGSMKSSSLRKGKPSARKEIIQTPSDQRTGLQENATAPAPPLIYTQNMTTTLAQTRRCCARAALRRHLCTPKHCSFYCLPPPPRSPLFPHRGPR